MNAIIVFKTLKSSHWEREQDGRGVRGHTHLLQHTHQKKKKKKNTHPHVKQLTQNIY